MLPSLISALVAAVAYGAATILQAIGVRRIAAAPPGLAWPRRLWAGRLYGVGLLLDLAGFAATVVALRRLPLFLVESAVASSVAVTAVLSVVVLHLRLLPREWLALGAVVVGLAGLAVTAVEGPPRHVQHGVGWAILAAAAVVLALLAAGLLSTGRASGMLLSITAGLGYAGVGIAARVLPASEHWWHLLARPALWALVVHGAAATVAYGFALDRARVTTVAAVTFAVETLVPSVVGLVWLGDAVRDHLHWLAAAGFALTLTGCLLLAGRAEPDHAQNQPARPAPTKP